ncbi:hypothetical protein [Idiomarina xiamenensis]|uniref:Uncharacterized protein n=1 Tax=Idiomarina xiamenensis 10-D-4 TaxID=740709 RepID=K2JDJ4_9GAMM|nr:hypothetical protein [Idiomarina xiamenensis]EKE81466.1 hypothetical protein A10D4_10326 [Idiomarina xiamenensis 10-D-4]
MLKDSLGFVVVIGLHALFSPASDAQALPEKNVQAYTCDDCSFSEAKNLVKAHSYPLLRCVAKDNSEIISIDNQACYSTPRYAAVLNEASGRLWGFQLSHSHQGMFPPVMQLQVVAYDHPQTVDAMIRNGVEYSNRLAARADSIANNLSTTFDTSQAFYDWLGDQAQGATKITAANTASANDFSCANGSSQYQAVKAATSGEFESRLQMQVNEQYANFDGTPGDFFDEVEFTGIGLGLQKLGFNVSLSWDNKQIQKNVAFNFPLPDGLAAEGNNQPSKVIFTLTPKGSHIEISLNHSLTYIGGQSWSVLTNPAKSTVELSPCVKVALTEAFGSPQTTPAGSVSGGGYKPLPTTGGGIGGGTPIGGGWDYQLCDAHFYDRNGNPLITIKVRC